MLPLFSWGNLDQHFTSSDCMHGTATYSHILQMSVTKTIVLRNHIKQVIRCKSVVCVKKELVLPHLILRHISLYAGYAKSLSFPLTQDMTILRHLRKCQVYIKTIFIHFILQNTSYIKTTWKLNVLKSDRNASGTNMQLPIQMHTHTQTQNTRQTSKANQRVNNQTYMLEVPWSVETFCYSISICISLLAGYAKRIIHLLTLFRGDNW